MSTYPEPRQRVRVPMPVKTPMTDDEGRVTVPWLYYLMQLASSDTFKDGRVRTLLLKTLAVGSDVADHTIVFAPGAARAVVGVLRLPITADLTVKLKLTRPPSAATEIITCTIPAATAVDTPIEFTGFAETPMAFQYLDVLSWAVTESDGQEHAAGVASFTVDWTGELWA